MWLPRGNLLKIENGPKPVEDMNARMSNDMLTGYARASIITSDRIEEAIIVYNSGRVFIAIASDDGQNTIQDKKLEAMTKIMKSDDAIIETCSINEKQLRLMEELYKDFIIPDAARQEASQKSAKLEAMKEIIPKLEIKPDTSYHPHKEPVKDKRQEPAKRIYIPEIRGQFLRTDQVSTLDEYIKGRQIDIGHIIFIKKYDDMFKEHHMIILGGKIQAAYTEDTAGPEVLQGILSSAGTVEFYMIDEPLIMSVLKKYPNILINSKRFEEEKEAKEQRRMGVPAKSIFDGGGKWSKVDFRNVSKPVEKEIMNEEDIMLVKSMEKDFASNVDDLLQKLELSHLRVKELKKKDEVTENERI
jgi:hypothetical protein